MGFASEDEFMQFRRKCNKISYNLRKNQYATALAVRKDRLQNRILELTDKLENMNSLQYPDKYGWEAVRDEDDEKKSWSLADVGKKQRESTMVFAEAERVLD